MEAKLKIKPRQTLIDIAIQAGGTLDSLFEVASLNGVGITDDLEAGSLVVSPAVSVMHVADYFRKYKLFPASATTALSEVLNEGVEFWTIGYDFKIR
jgi:hypothetical protein